MIQQYPGPVIVEHMALLNEAQILESNEIPKQNRQNMTNAEFIAKKDLANDKSIIIKKADKGSAVVVQNHSDYKAYANYQIKTFI